jgi:hypothetical protein
MTIQEKIEYLDTVVRARIQRVINRNSYFYFCPETKHLPIPLCYDNFEEFRILEALELCGGKNFHGSVFTQTLSKLHVPYNEWKMQILDKAIELLKEEL